jgi:hypothetical protein
MTMIVASTPALADTAVSVPGVTLSIATELSPIATTTPPPSKTDVERRQRVAAWLNLAAALGLTGIGIYTIAKDGDCSLSRNGVCAATYSSMSAGILLTSIGAVATSAMGLWLIKF